MLECFATDETLCLGVDATPNVISISVQISNGGRDGLARRRHRAVAVGRLLGAIFTGFHQRVY